MGTKHSSESQSSEKSILKRQQSYHEQNCHRPQEKKNVTFDTVAVYYYPLVENITSDPSQGGSARGMAPRHIHTQCFSISEYDGEQQHLHPQDFLQSNSDRLDDQGDTVASNNYSQSEEQSNASEPELDLDSCSSLQPGPLLKRRYLTRASGARKKHCADPDVCTDIRVPPTLCDCS
jgi:cysteine/serine-rich nuclear protein